MPAIQTLPATTRRGVQVVVSPRKLPAGAVCGPRRNNFPVLTAYRLPTFVNRPLFSVRPSA